MLCFLAAATDCSGYFKLGVKGTTFQKCEHTSLCYAPSWVCDGANDCGDYSDERNCPGESSGARSGECNLGSGPRCGHLTVSPAKCSLWGPTRQQGPVPPCLWTFSFQTRWEGTQMSSQLLCLPKREVHPHDLDL